MRYEQGQLLAELLIAMGIFAIAASVIIVFVLDTYLSDRVGREITVATFLAKEGIEAVKSIRNNDWDNLLNGEHGLEISGGNWVFQGSQEDVSTYLREGQRKIIVEEIDSDRKKITSQIDWRISENRVRDIIFVTYLTNWQKSPPFVAQLHYRWRSDEQGE